MAICEYSELGRVIASLETGRMSHERKECLKRVIATGVPMSSKANLLFGLVIEQYY